MSHKLEGRVISGTKETRVDRDIKSPEVRLIDETGSQAGIVPISVAMDRAKSVGLNLVEVSPHAVPPVCRIMDFGKFQFDSNKRRSVSHKKQRTTRVQVKELKFGVRIEEADYQVKLRNLIRFLSDGNKVKVTLRFRGREIAFQDIGIDLMKRVKANAEVHAMVEQEPKLEGRQIVMVLAPKKNG